MKQKENTISPTQAWQDSIFGSVMPLIHENFDEKYYEITHRRGENSATWSIAHRAGNTSVCEVELGVIDLFHPQRLKQALRAVDRNTFERETERGRKKCVPFIGASVDAFWLALMVKACNNWSQLELLFDPGGAKQYTIAEDVQFMLFEGGSEIHRCVEFRLPGTQTSLQIVLPHYQLGFFQTYRQWLLANVLP